MRKSWLQRTAARSICRGVLVMLALIVAPSFLPAGGLDRKDAPEIKLAPVTPLNEGAIVIPGAVLKKGTPRTAAMRDLSKLYELQKLKSAEGDEDSWLITEKETPDNYLGVVSFADGKLNRVARFRKWTQDQDSVELAQRLCDLVEQLTKQRGGQLEVTTKTNDSGKFTVRGMEMISGDKRISLNLITHPRGADPASRLIEVHLDEVIQ